MMVWGKTRNVYKRGTAKRWSRQMSSEVLIFKNETGTSKNASGKRSK